MAIQTQPGFIPAPFANSGTKNVIPETMPTPSASAAASWTDGFPTVCSLPLASGGIPPARADFNGLFNSITQAQAFYQSGGVYEWDATVDYGTNRMILGSDGKLYWSMAQSGPNTGAGAIDPTTDDGTYWQAPYAKTMPPLDNSAAAASTEWVRNAIVGAEMYVDGISGDDANDGLTSGTAVKTIGKAIELAEERTGQGMVINVAGGTYTEELKIYNKHIYFNLSGDIVINGYLEGLDEAIIAFSYYNVTINSENANALRIINQSYFYASNDVTLNRTGATSSDCMIVSFNSLVAISGNLAITGSNTNRSLYITQNSFARIAGNLSISDTNRTGHAIQLLLGCLLEIAGTADCSVGNSNIITAQRSSLYNCYGKTTVVSKSGIYAFVADEQSGVILNGGAAVSGGGIAAINTASLSYGRINSSLSVSGTYSNAVVLASNCSFIGINNTATISGSPTGKRYNCSYHSCILVYGAGANRIPGTVAGTADSASYSYYG